jgi:transposase
MHWVRDTELNPVYRRLVKMALEELQLIEQQIGQLDQEIASLLRQHQDAGLLATASNQ